MKDLETLRQFAAEERSRQSRSALRTVFVVCPAIAIGVIILLRVLMLLIDHTIG